MTVYCDFCPNEVDDEVAHWPHEPRCADPFGCDCHIAACPGCCPCSDVGFEVDASACPPQEMAGGAHVLPASPTSAPARASAALAGTSATSSTTAPARRESPQAMTSTAGHISSRTDGETGPARMSATTNDKTVGAATPTASVHPRFQSSQEVLT